MPFRRRQNVNRKGTRDQIRAAVAYFRSLPWDEDLFYDRMNRGGTIQMMEEVCRHVNLVSFNIPDIVRSIQFVYTYTAPPELNRDETIDWNHGRLRGYARRTSAQATRHLRNKRYIIFVNGRAPTVEALIATVIHEFLHVVVFERKSVPTFNYGLNEGHGFAWHFSILILRRSKLRDFVQDRVGCDFCDPCRRRLAQRIRNPWPLWRRHR